MIAKKTNQPERQKAIRKNLSKRFQHITTDQIIYITFGVYLLVTLLGYTVIPEISKLADISLKLLKYFCCIIFLYKAFIDLKQDKKVSLSIIIFTILNIIFCIFSKPKSFSFLLCVNRIA